MDAIYMLKSVDWALIKMAAILLSVLLAQSGLWESRNKTPNFFFTNFLIYSS